MTKRYAKPDGANDLPKWFKEIRAGSDFMPAKIKPVSYNFMAQAETPARKSIYGHNPPPVGILDDGAKVPPGYDGAALKADKIMRTDLGTYYTPTADVEAGVKRNFSIIQSIKTLGGEVKERAGSLVNGLIDVISRPQYMFMNMYKDNLEHWYMDENSAGGKDVTGGEHLAALMTGVSGFGIARNILAGRGSETGRAAAAGLKGEAKTLTADILELQTPDFVKEHPKLAAAAAITGDVVLDPVNFLGVAAVPGSITKAVGSSSLRMMGNKSAALRMWDETFFSKAGREAAKNTIKRDIIQKDVNKLDRKLRKIARDEGKRSPKYTDAVREAKKAELSAKISAKMAEDLKGAELAWRVIKKGAPTLGITTVSRFSTAAANANTALKGARTLKEAHAAITASTVDTFAKNAMWSKIFTDLRGQDITYTHAHRTYTVKLSDLTDGDDATFREWLRRVVSEGSPVAAYAEHGTRAARSRGGRINAAEARGQAFINHLQNYVDGTMARRLDQPTLDAFTIGKITPEAFAASDLARKKLIDEPSVARFESLDDLEGLTFDQLKSRVLTHWQNNGGKGKNNAGKSVILIKDSNGDYRALSLESLRKRAQNDAELGATRLAGEAKAATLTPAERAIDSISGVSSDAANARARSLAAYEERAKAAQAEADQASAVANAATEAAMSEPGSAALMMSFDKAIKNIPDITDAERAQLEAILADTKLTPAEKVTQVLSHDAIGDDSALGAIEEFFQMAIKDGQVYASTTGKGSGIEALPELFSKIVEDRWGARTTRAMERGSGVGFDTVNKRLQAIKRDLKQGDNFLRDVHGEIAMMVTEAYRQAINYAVEAELFSDPEVLFSTINHAMDEFMNAATAETKAQTMQMMFNLTGMRLPENFVPTFDKVDDTLKNFKFMRNSESAYVDQEAIWGDLGAAVQEWAIRLFPDIPVDRYVRADGVNVRTGFDVAPLREQVAARAAAKPLPSEKVDALVLKVNKLHDQIAAAGDGLIDGQRAVNRYDMLDFLMHAEDILKTQKTTLHAAGGEKGISIRMNAGRLSALDSFAFVDDATKEGLKALASLKRLANGSTKEADAAKQAFAKLFAENGGLDYLDRITIPETGKVADIDFKSVLTRLGSHARIKEEAIRRNSQGSKFGAKYRADLMDAMWGHESLMHEWQKALQNKILKDVYVDGITKEEAARRLSKNIDETFANYDKVKRMLYPVMRNAKIKDEQGNVVGRGLKETKPDMEGNQWTRTEAIQKSWGGNEFEGKRNSPKVQEVDSAEIPFPEGIRPDAEVKGVRGQVGLDVEKAQAEKGLLDAGVPEKIVNDLFAFKADEVNPAAVSWRGISADGKQIGVAVEFQTTKRKMNITRVWVKGEDTVRTIPTEKNFGESIKSAFKRDVATHRHDPSIAPEDYAPDAVLKRGIKDMPPKKVGSVYDESSPEVIRTGDAWQAGEEAKLARIKASAATADYERAVKSSDGADLPPTAVNPDEVSPDFPNIVSPQDLSELGAAEKSAIVDWIKSQYADAPPEMVAVQLKAVSNAMTQDLMIAQARIQTGMADMSIKHGRDVRIAGVPFMKLGHFSATDGMAGVTALEDTRAGAVRFFGDAFRRTGRIDDTKPSGYQKFMEKFSRQSRVLEGSLDRIRMFVVNASHMERKRLIDILNDLYINGINKGTFVNSNVAAMTPKQRAKYVSRAFFDTHTGVVPDKIEEFAYADGNNPVRLIQAQFESIAQEVFFGQSTTSVVDQIKTFNRYMDKRFRLSDEELDVVLRGINTGKIDDTLIPYTREWLIQAGKELPPKSHLHIDKLLDVNMAELHYAMQDAKLKIKAGRQLHEGAFAEFAFKMDPEVVRFHNKTLSPSTTDAKGERLRGDILSIRDLVNRNIIDKKYVPKEYATGEYYIQEWMVPHLNMLFRYMNDVNIKDRTLDVGFINKVQNYFKASVTIYALPTYPVRNTMADVFMSFMDGLYDPRHYRDAAEVIQSSHKTMREIDIRDYQNILDADWMKYELARAAADPASVKQIDDINPKLTPRITMMTDDGVVKLNDAQIMHLYDSLGLGQNRVVGEFAESVAAIRQSSMGKATGAVHDKVKNLNDVREDSMRMAHFLFAIKDEAPLGGTMDDIVRRAADRVMKYHFDYGDVSIWERASLSYHIPFYKWVKNIIPFTLEAMVTTPRYLNIEEAINRGVGVAINDNPDEMGFKDFVLPEYIARERAVPIGSFVNNNGNKFNQYMMLSLPLTDTLSRTISPTIEPLINGNYEGFGGKLGEAGAGAITTALSMTTPIHKGTMQAAFGQTLWPTGAAPERKGESWYNTMAAVIPGFPALTNVEKQAKGLLKDGAEYDDLNASGAILDSLGAANVYNNTESAQKGSLQVTEDRLMGSLYKSKAEAATKLKEKFPHLTDDQVMAVLNQYVKEVKAQNKAW